MKYTKEQKNSFKNRKRELKLFEQIYESGKPKLIVFYGRRRVGKTELLKEFLKKHKGIYLLARQEPEKEQLVKFSAQIAEFFNDDLLKVNPLVSWDALFTYLSKKKETLIIFDEFPYTVQTSKKLPSVLQDYWDNEFSKKKSFIVLCGSSINMMESLLGHKSPIYGRRTEQIMLEPLTFSDACLFFPKKMPLKDKIIYYSIIGGTPAYLLEIDFRRSLEDNLRDNILRKNKFLYQDVMFVLREELKEPRNYFSILVSLSKGNTKISRIVNDVGLEKTFVSKYLSVLTSLQLVERRVPITERNFMKSRRGLYFIKDNYFRFWFRFVFPYIEYVEQERQNNLIKEIIMPELNSFAGRTFEDIVLSEIAKSKKYRSYLFGRWWDNELECDIVALDKTAKKIIIGEVKFSEISRKDIKHIEESLREKAKRINTNSYKEKFLIVCLDHEDYKTSTELVKFKDMI